MADAGITEILIANQIVGAIKVRRLIALLERAPVIVSVDNLSNIAERADAAQDANQSCASSSRSISA